MIKQDLLFFNPVSSRIAAEFAAFLQLAVDDIRRVTSVCSTATLSKLSDFFQQLVNVLRREENI